MDTLEAIKSLDKLDSQDDSLSADARIHLTLELTRFSKKPFTKVLSVKCPFAQPWKLCFLIKDGEQTTFEFLRAHGIPADAIYFVSDLCTKFKVFQERRLFTKQFDRVVADERIFHLLPKLFGKRLFGELKGAIPFDFKRQLNTADILAISQAIYFKIPTGPCLDVELGSISHLLSLSSEALLAILESIKTVVEKKLGAHSIYGMNMKLPKSLSIPLSFK
jgi:hypothetical protein